MEWFTTVFGCSSCSKGKDLPKSDIIDATSASDGATVTGATATNNTATSNTVAQFQKDLFSENEHKKFTATMHFLAQIPLLERLPRDQHPLITKCCELRHFASGKTVVSQGEIGQEFFVLCKGNAEVSVTVPDLKIDKKLATLTVGDYFGESALLHDEPRAATVTAVSELAALVIKRDSFEELGLASKLKFINRRANVGAKDKGVRRTQRKTPSKKQKADLEFIAAAIKANKNLSKLMQMDQKHLNKLTEVTWKMNVKDEQEVITQGDLNADNFYIVKEGSFKVTADGNEVGQLGVGDSFGEIALLYVCPRAATVMALENSVVWGIDRPTFKDIMLSVADEQLDEYVAHLNKVEMLAGLLAEEKRSLAKALVECTFSEGDKILKQGEPGNTLYILTMGEVSIQVNGKEVKKLARSRLSDPPLIFGEKALLQNEMRAATVEVTSSTAHVMALDREAFEITLGPMEEIMKGSRGSKRASLKPVVQSHQTGKILFRELTRIGRIGLGGHATVDMYGIVGSEARFALKYIGKGLVAQAELQEELMNEKDVLLSCNSPFIVQLFETYAEMQDLYFLLEVGLGGELHATYKLKELYGNEPLARYYIAGMVLALAHLHERRVVYRDMKPENVVLDAEGLPKLIDMGLAKFVIAKTYTICGVPEYMAPEILFGKGYDHTADWWSLGILAFELGMGNPPFQGKDQFQINDKVIRGLKDIKFPLGCSTWSRDFIAQLLKLVATQRLPAQPGGIDNIKKHHWFADAKFDWGAYEALTMKPPWKPKLKKAWDLSNFNPQGDPPKRTVAPKQNVPWFEQFATSS